ncbi:BTAD domain-containing putative transcriptional regulator [Nocardia sp. NPDC006630]|uniref:BTAD domain-containing putative transcriptional regulator n=1 Tax=Nocardia sp. NPDC006630 TaxID=3157181 RepID=UPI0033A95794
MQFGILGSIEVRRSDGTPIAVGGPQVRSLLALLLLDAGRLVSRERLIDGLYGEDPPGDAAHALQSQVSRLRRALRNGSSAQEFVESSSAGYRLAVDPQVVDVHRFAKLAEDGRNALRDRDAAAAVTLFDAAMTLWRGPALADVLDSPFAEVQAARLNEARLEVLADRAEAALTLGDHHAVVSTLPELVALHPLRERLRALLMRALYAAGRQADALESFEQGRLLLADELGADPGAELAEAHLAILRADAAPTAALGRLPAQFTSFVGRESELAQLIPLLAQSRLVTLIGPGGTGKTRLALEAGAGVRGDRCLVELAALTDGAQLAPAVIAALGGRDATQSGHRDPEAQLLALLTDRPLLLILDNCEHLVLDTARLAHRLLLSCPALRILATSREPLSITGETVFRVPQLPVPAPEARLAGQLRSPAVRLFADRAAAARPGFTVDAGTITAVARICTRLDGLPLAIELAAARLRTLGLDDIDARLDNRFRLLSRGDRTADPRHQTLQAVVAWSWDLLDPPEQQLAQRLAVISGGATLAAVTRICGSLDPTGHPASAAGRLTAPPAHLSYDADWPEADELLPALVEKSLVTVVDGRYRMLETIREFALRHLIESGDHTTLLRAHAEYYTALAEQADPALRGPDQLTWLSHLTADHDNLQAALHWAVPADPPLALRLIAAQAWYWWLTGRPGSAPELANVLLTRLDSPLASRMDSIATAEEYALCVAVAARGGALTAPPIEDHAPHAEQAGTSGGRAAGTTAVERAAAGIAAQAGPLRRPHAVLLLALAGGLMPGDPAELVFGPGVWPQAFQRLGTGLGLLMSGHAIEAEPEFRVALAGFRRTGDRWAIAATLDKLAAVADLRGDRAASLALIDEAITLGTELGMVADAADLLNRRGDIHARNADSEQECEAARADYERAAELSRSIGATDMRANALCGLGDIARRTDQDVARARYEAALALPGDDSFGSVEARARALIGLGWLAITETRQVQAVSSHREALALALGSSLSPIAAGAVEGLAGAALVAGDTERAATLLGAAEALRGVALAGAPEAADVAVDARKALGGVLFDAAYRRGVALSPDQVLALVGSCEL